MNKNSKFFSLNILWAVILTVFLVACEPSSDESQVQAEDPGINLDMLYASPSIIGTTPKGATWSSNSELVAFLWNDKGQTFRDIWVYSPETGQKHRFTNLEREISSDKLHSGISEVVWLDSPRDQLAYVLKGQLYVYAHGGSSSLIEHDKSDIRRLALSPDGQYISFVSSNGLWVLPTNRDDNTTARQLVKFDDPKAYIESYHWSDDSRQIIFNLTDESPLPERDIYYYAHGSLQNNHVTRAFPGDETADVKIGMVSLEKGDIQFFTRPDDKHPVWNYGLSHDGKSVFINSSDFLVKEHTVTVYDVKSGESEVFYQEQDDKHLRPDWQVAWAPKDDGLIIMTDREGFLHLYHQKTAASEPRALTNGSWEIASFTVDSDHNQIYFLANKAHLAEKQIYRVSMAGGNVERVSADTQGTHRPVFSPNMKYAATSFSNDVTPLEIQLVDLDKKQTVAVTQSPLPEFYQQTWAKISYVEFDSHVDGTRLVGRLSLPADYDPAKRYPMIVGSIYSDSVNNQYGGRTSHPTWGLDQYFVAQGYIVLNVNIRGSWGQGRVHNQGLRHSYGGIDIEDLHSGVKHLVKEGIVDPDRVGIWGSSYGGLMTMMSLFKKPGVYAAGIAGAPATHVDHAYPEQMWVMGKPTGDDQPGRYESQSAVYHTKGLQDPLMIIHGSKDNVVLYSDTMTVVEKLIADEKMFELVTLPGSGHGWDNEGPAQRRFAFKKMVAFFNRHLKPQK